MTVTTAARALPDIRPTRSLVLLSTAHAVNHAHAVVLPLIFLQIIDEYGVGIDAIAFLAAIGNLSSGLVQLSYAQLTRVVSRRRLLGAGGLLLGGGFVGQAFATSFATFAVPNVLSRIGGSPQHPVGNGLLAEQAPGLQATLDQLSTFLANTSGTFGQYQHQRGAAGEAMQGEEPPHGSTRFCASVAARFTPGFFLSRA